MPLGSRFTWTFLVSLALVGFGLNEWAKDKASLESKPGIEEQSAFLNAFSAESFRAFAVKDDLKLSKKGPKSPEADEAKAASPVRIGKAAAAAKVPPAGKERGIQRDEPAVEQPRPQQQARGRREKIEPIR
ncbi:MAG TPA: hypothetical protein VG826_11140, partial [Pirellulales bacterium]|nr:hypothetical protein [Pirellulales bacterium]